MDTKPLVLVLLFLAITPNLGFFTVPSILIITSVLALMFTGVIHIKRITNLKQIELKNILPYVFFILLFYSVMYYGGLYQNKNSVVVGYYILSAFIAINLLRFFLYKKTFSILFVCTIYLLMSFWTILNSPHPTVDTIVVLKEAPLMLLSGKNPYSSTFTQVYQNIKPDYYNYLPFSFFYALPFVLLFQDPRYMIIFSNLISVFILYKLFKNSDHDNFLNLFILAFLFLPRSFYMLEHSYLDPVVFSFFLLFVYFFIKKKRSAISFFFLGLFFSFKQPPILTLPFFLKEKKISQVFFKTPSLILFLLPFALPVFYLFINKKAFIEDIFTSLDPTRITSPISASLTLPTLLRNISFQSNYTYPIGLVLLLISIIYIFRARISLVYKITFFLLCFNFFTYHAFFNSYYLVAQFLLFDIAVDYFSLEVV